MMLDDRMVTDAAFDTPPRGNTDESADRLFLR
jgi:hypothetical protein